MTQLNKIYQVAFLQTKDEEILLEGTVHDETFKQKREELRKLQTTSVGKEFAAARARADKTAQEWSEAKAKRQGNKRKAAMWVFRTQRRPVFRTRRRSSKFRLLERSFLLVTALRRCAFQLSGERSYAFACTPQQPSLACTIEAVEAIRPTRATAAGRGSHRMCAAPRTLGASQDSLCNRPSLSFIAPPNS